MSVRAVSRPIRRRNPEKTERQLLDSAIALFSASGFHGVSVEEIVRRAKTTKRMLYHYFGNKQDIYLAVLVEVFGRLERVELAVADNLERPDEKLRHLLAAYIEFLDRNPEFVRLLLWENLEHGRNILREPDRFAKNPFLERFQTIVAEGVQQGLFRAPRNVKHLLVNLIALVFIYHSNRYSLAVSLRLDLDTPQNRELRLSQAVDLVFGGLLAK